MFAFVQARMGSTRLPGKVLKQLSNGQSIIANVIDRIPSEVIPIVLTSSSCKDDELVHWCVKNGVQYFRGDELNVLNRYIQACDQVGLKDNDYFFRVCSDNPLLESKSFLVLNGLLSEHKVDYISFSLDGKPSILSHCGLYPELIRVGALKTPGPSLSLEHVTSHLYLDNFRTYYFESDVDRRMRLTVDDPQDLINVNFVLENILPNDLSEILEYEELINSMHKQILKYSKI